MHKQKHTKVKVKKTSTIPQKIHNTFSKHKKYSGVKSKLKVNKPVNWRSDNCDFFYLDLSGYSFKIGAS